MTYDALPEEIKVNLRWFDDQEAAWEALSDSMSHTHARLTNGEKIPPFSPRIPANLNSYGQGANDALAAYLHALDLGRQCSAAVASTLDAAAQDYLRNEGFAVELVQQIDKELDE